MCSDVVTESRLERKKRAMLTEYVFFLLISLSYLLQRGE